MDLSSVALSLTLLAVNKISISKRECVGILQNTMTE